MDEMLTFDLDVNVMSGCIFVILLSVRASVFYPAVEVFAHILSNVLVGLLCIES